MKIIRPIKKNLKNHIILFITLCIINNDKNGNQVNVPTILLGKWMDDPDKISK